MLPVVTLVHIEASDHGTLGQLFVDGKPLAYSMELPDRGNQRNRSRIPAGRYSCKWHRSFKFGWCYAINDVPGRSHILFHSGNFGGDRLKGFKTHTHGCVLLGSALGWLGKQRAVFNSRTTTRHFFELMNRSPFELVVLNGKFSFVD